MTLSTGTGDQNESAGLGWGEWSAAGSSSMTTADMEQLLHDYLGTLTTTSLRNRIREFRRLDLRRQSYEEIRQEIRKVLAPGGEMSLVRLPSVCRFPKGQKFYRVRCFVDGKNPVVMSSDCWAPPPEVTPAGRINSPGNPVLYTALDGVTAADEMAATDGRPIIMITYEATEDMDFGFITWEPTTISKIFSASLDNSEVEKLTILHDFLVDEFTRDAGRETEQRYMITNAIAHDHFNLPAISGYCYPLVVRRQDAMNVGFFPTHQDRLEVKDIAHLELYSMGGPAIVKCVAVYRIADNGDIVVNEV